METSPYAPPRAAVADPSAPASVAEAIRQEHIAHEVQLKSVGTLYYLGGFVGTLAGLAILLPMLTHSDDRAPLAIAGAIYLILGPASLALGYGFRRLRPWVVVPGTALSVLGLLAVPLGTLINGWILYLIHCKKGRTVLAPDYQAIVDATPHVKNRRGVGDWILIGLLVLLLVGVVAAVAIGALARH
jgi:hypothetical protein